MKNPKLKKPQTRNRLETRVKRSRSSQERQILAKYGELSPQLWFVDSVHDQLKNPQQSGKSDANLPIAEVDGETFLDIRPTLGIFLSECERSIRKLDGKFFADVSVAIEIIKRHSHDKLPLHRKLSDPRFSWCRPPPTLEQIAKFICRDCSSVEAKQALRHALRQIGVPWTRSKGGQPRKSRGAPVKYSSR